MLVCCINLRMFLCFPELGFDHSLRNTGNRVIKAVYSIVRGGCENLANLSFLEFLSRMNQAM